MLFVDYYYYCYCVCEVVEELYCFLNYVLLPWTHLWRIYFASTPTSCMLQICVWHSLCVSHFSSICMFLTFNKMDNCTLWSSQQLSRSKLCANVVNVLGCLKKYLDLSDSNSTFAQSHNTSSCFINDSAFLSYTVGNHRNTINVTDCMIAKAICDQQSNRCHSTFNHPRMKFKRIDFQAFKYLRTFESLCIRLPSLTHQSFSVVPRIRSICVKSHNESALSVLWISFGSKSS